MASRWSGTQPAAFQEIAMHARARSIAGSVTLFLLFSSAFSAIGQVSTKPCPSSTPASTPTGGTTGQGHSNTSSGRAEAKAIEKLENALAVHAGVACSICPGDLLQCERDIEYPEGSSPSVADYDCGGQWTHCKQASYSGAYTVTCAECP